MDIYQNKPRIKLTPTVRYGRKFIEAAFDDDSLRIPLSKEEGIQLVGGKAYLPEELMMTACGYLCLKRKAFNLWAAKPICRKSTLCLRNSLTVM